MGEYMYKKQLATKHLKDLKVLGYIPDTLEPLLEIENEAHQMAEDECNGVKEYSPENWDIVLHQVRKLFTKALPGLMINGDPRGYTLKIRDDIVKKENIEIYTDWGGYGILCPDFEI